MEDIRFILIYLFNFDSSLAGVNIYRYTKTMMVTNLPALSITCVIFAVLGRQYGGGAADTAAVRAICDGLAGIYHLSPVLWLPLLVICTLTTIITFAATAYSIRFTIWLLHKGRRHTA